METDGRPPARDAGKTLAGRKDLTHRDLTPGDLARRRRARNWALLAVLLGLSALFYAITLVKLAKTG